MIFLFGQFLLGRDLCCFRVVLTEVGESETESGEVDGEERKGTRITDYLNGVGEGGADHFRLKIPEMTRSAAIKGE
jgi:hypothetical protein